MLNNVLVLSRVASLPEERRALVHLFAVLWSSSEGTKRQTLLDLIKAAAINDVSADCLGSNITSAGAAVQRGSTRPGKTPADGTQKEILCFLMGSFFCRTFFILHFSHPSSCQPNMLTPKNAKAPWMAAAHSKFKCCVRSPPTVGP